VGVDVRNPISDLVIGKVWAKHHVTKQTYVRLFLKFVLCVTVIHGSLDHSNFVDPRKLVIADIETF
jgi:hypothetical protein